MDNETSVAILERASLMLAEANTIQKAQELKNLALTAADWAKHKGLGNAAIQHCRSYALEAERKMGEMLEATERANAARDKKKAESPDVTPPPTLADLGLSKRQDLKQGTFLKYLHGFFKISSRQKQGNGAGSGKILAFPKH